MCTQPVILDSTLRSSEAAEFGEALRAKIVRQEEAVQAMVDCGEFQHSHEISKLIGSPPGYLGHRETHPLITQEALAASHTDKLKLSFLLFDEIETANGQFLFRVTDAGREFLLYEGMDQRYGARHLKRAIERHVVFPLANLLATG